MNSRMVSWKALIRVDELDGLSKPPEQEGGYVRQPLFNVPEGARVAVAIETPNNSLPLILNVTCNLPE